ncbi:MAG: hypothetical protein ACI8T1_001248 [Verrucomicrobiales bacterium]|jgi:hypothetical protein
MKKALENPIIVGILAIAAIVVVYRSIFSKPVYAVPAAVNQQSQEEKPVESASSNLRIDASTAQWSTLAERDPFRAESEEEEKETVNEDDPLEPVSSVLKLSAISLEGTRQFAVINNTVIAEGERILEYEVEKILADHVLVNGPMGHTLIGFFELPIPEDTERQIAGNIEEP